MNAKHTTKKALSVLLAVLMLVMVFPAGVVTITAAGKDGDFALNDTDTTYTIDGPLDWNEVARLSAAGETFAGKTIQLAADIDGTAAKEAGVTLATPLFTSFAGTFTGLKNANGATNAEKYYTVSNVTSTKTVIADKVAAAATFTSLNFDSVRVENPDGTSISVLIGEETFSGEGGVKINYIYMDNCTAIGNSNVALLVGKSTGGASDSSPNLVINNVTITNGTATGTDSQTALLCAYASHTVKLTDVSVHGTVTGAYRAAAVIALGSGGRQKFTLTRVNVLEGTVVNGGTTALTTDEKSQLNSALQGNALFIGQLYKVNYEGFATFNDCSAKGTVNGVNKNGLYVGHANGEGIESNDTVTPGYKLTFNNCSAQGTVNGSGTLDNTAAGKTMSTNTHSALYVGHSENSSVTITNCTAQGTVTGNAENGLFVGRADGDTKSGTAVTIKGSTANGTVNATGSSNALYVGHDFRTPITTGTYTPTGGSAIPCVASGTVKGSSYLGGVIGRVFNKADHVNQLKDIQVKDLTVNGSFGISGVVGMLRNDSNNKVAQTLTLENVDLTDVTVKATGYGAGGVLGAMTDIGAATITINNSDLTNIQVLGTDDGATNVGGVVGRLTTAAALTISNLTLSGENVVSTTAVAEQSPAADRGVGGLIGANQSSSSSGVKIQNVTIEDQLTVSYNNRAGALIGKNHSKVALLIDGVTVAEGATVQVNGATDAAAVGISKAGGLIGEKTSTGSVAIKNVTFAGSVTTTAENGISGGVIGNWEENSKLAVSNVTVTETGAVTLSAKNSAGVVVGRMVGSNAEHEIANIVSMGTLSLTTKNMDGYQGAGGVIGYYQASDTAETLTVTNVALDNLTVESNTGKSLAGQDLVSMNRESIGVGGVIGNYRAWINSALIIQNVLIGGGTLSMTGIGSDGSTIYHKDGSVGGILGYVSEYAGMYKVDHDGDSTTATEYVLDRYTGTITIANCETNLALNSAIKTSNQGVGGLVGSYGQRGQNDDAIPDSHASSVLNISDCVVGGSVSGANNSVAGVIGFVGFCGSTVNINRVIVDASAITTTDDAQVGLILGRALRTGIALTVANCSTTLTEAISMAGDLGAQKGHEPTDDGYALTGCTIMVNGIAYTAGTDGWNGGAFDLQSDVIAIVSDAEIAKMVTYGTDGYIDSVRGHVVGGYEQHTTPGEDGTYDIRFIALVNQNDENVKEYGISLRMTDSNGEVTYFAVTCEAYEVLEGFDREGLPAYEYDAMDDYGAKKFIAAVATNVPMEALTFDVIAWYTTNSGVTVYDTIKTAEYSNAGVLVNAM